MTKKWGLDIDHVVTVSLTVAVIRVGSCTELRLINADAISIGLRCGLGTIRCQHGIGIIERYESDRLLLKDQCLEFLGSKRGHHDTRVVKAGNLVRSTANSRIEEKINKSLVRGIVDHCGIGKFCLIGSGKL